MALIASLGCLLGAAIFGTACAGLGHRLCRLAALKVDNDLERLLYSAAFGVISYEAALALLEFTLRPRVAVGILLALIALFGALEFSQVWSVMTRIGRRVVAGSPVEHLLSAVLFAVLAFEAMAAMAPLAGSDALHYHFTAPLLVARNGFAPNFWLVHTFLTGQGHLLILTGLALGSEKLALALLFLGGLLSAASCACLCRKWAAREGAWLSALAFLLTPVVFWQISAAGTPDIWMPLFAATAALFVARFATVPRLAPAFFAGVLAGALAGAKYTGCILCAVVALAFLLEARSIRGLVPFFAGAFAAGLWPYLRNALWAGDPFFPFLTPWISPQHMNPFALASISADTGASAHRTLLQLAQFPLFSAVDQAHLGFWQFFGPLCLAFAPLVFLAIRNTPLWRATLVIWLLGAMGIGFASGMLRFLLPLLPMALAAVFAGWAAVRPNWKFARALSLTTILALLTACAAALALYGHTAAAAGIGLINQQSYLRRRAPDYGKVEFINQTLRGQGSRDKTLVFLRHLYYLQMPFVSGDPNDNWNVDPRRLSSPEAWRAFFRAENIRWIVRAPDYPAAIAAPLKQLEAEGALEPVARGEVTDFAGMRIFNQRQTFPVVILRTRDGVLLDRGR